MFTGIVEEVGVVKQIKKNLPGAGLYIKATTILADLKPGDSVAVDGVCLTASRIESTGFWADVMPQTFKLTAASVLQAGAAVNLERAACLGGRMGGHLVQGHVDGLAVVVAVESGADARLLHLETTAAVARYLVLRGSVALSGVSLTIAGVKGRRFWVSLVGHTLASTTLGRLAVGQSVNIETDIIGRYIEKLIAPSPPDQVSSTGNDQELLRTLSESGFM